MPQHGYAITYLPTGTSITGGLLSESDAKAIEDAGLGSAADFLHIAQTQTQLISDLAPEAKSLEGYLFPNTYQFTRAQSLADMAAAMVHEFRQVAQQIGLIRGVSA